MSPRSLAAALLFVSSLFIAPGVPFSGRVPGPAPAIAQGQVQMEWLGHMFFRFTSPNGVVVLTSPWLTNPDSPIDLDGISRADIILAPNSHGDDYGQATEIANKTRGVVITPRILGEWMIMNRSLDPATFIGAEPGTSFSVQGITINVVLNEHDNTIRTEPPVDAGPALGYFITFENGYTVYFAASSAPYPAMRDHARAFQPSLVLINAFNNPAPEFGDIVEMMLSDNPRPLTIIPTHRRAGAVELFEYSFEVAQRGFPVSYFEPTIGTPYLY